MSELEDLRRAVAIAKARLESSPAGRSRAVPPVVEGGLRGPGYFDGELSRSALPQDVKDAIRKRLRGDISDREWFRVLGLRYG